MVNYKILWKGPKKDYINRIGFSKPSEYLYIESLNYDEEENEVDSCIIELATSNQQIRELRDFLNGLELGDHGDDDQFGYEYEGKKFEMA